MSPLSVIVQTYVIIVPYAIGSVEGTVAVCYNEQQRKDLRESRYDEMTEAKKYFGSRETN